MTEKKKLLEVRIIPMICGMITGQVTKSTIPDARSWSLRTVPLTSTSIRPPSFEKEISRPCLRPTACLKRLPFVTATTVRLKVLDFRLNSNPSLSKVERMRSTA